MGLWGSHTQSSPPSGCRLRISTAALALRLLASIKATAEVERGDGNSQLKMLQGLPFPPRLGRFSRKNPPWTVTGLWLISRVLKRLILSVFPRVLWHFEQSRLLGRKALPRLLLFLAVLPRMRRTHTSSRTATCVCRLRPREVSLLSQKPAARTQASGTLPPSVWWQVSGCLPSPVEHWHLGVISGLPLASEPLSILSCGRALAVAPVL